MEIRQLPINLLEQNKGQVEGLPTNPRQWTKDDVTRIAASLQETPELFEARPLLVLPHADRYVILGGNLRYEGARRNKMKTCPCIVFPEDTSLDKLKEITIKDNGAFGAWDFDMLANEWDDLPLVDWGVSAWSTDIEVSPDALQDEEEEEEEDEEIKLTITIPSELVGNYGDIKQAVKVTLEEWPGCTIK